jgi:hypothetical protein
MDAQWQFHGPSSSHQHARSAPSRTAHDPFQPLHRLASCTASTATTAAPTTVPRAAGHQEGHKATIAEIPILISWIHGNLQSKAHKVVLNTQVQDFESCDASPRCPGGKRTRPCRSAFLVMMQPRMYHGFFVILACDSSSFGMHACIQTYLLCQHTHSITEPMDAPDPSGYI